MPLLPFDDDLTDGQQHFGRASAMPPERFNRRKPVQRKARARRSRSNEVAKRGMHQRRNKRLAW